MNRAAQRALVLAALLPVLGSVYQTLVLTDLVDADIRRGVGYDKGDGTWLSASWGLSMLFGVFAGLALSRKFGPRNILVAGMLVFALGNLMCGCAEGFRGLMLARFVEGLGKGMAIVLLRSFLYSRFDRMVFIAVLCYGLLAYSTRGTSPMVAAMVNEALGWNWVYWLSVPAGIGGAGLILLLVPADSPSPHANKGPKPDGLLIMLLVSWLISLLFVLGWREKEGGFTSNLYMGLLAFNALLFACLAGRMMFSYSRGDQFARLLRSRSYLCSMGGRMLLLLHLAAILGVLSSFLTEGRGMPAVEAGSLFLPATISMAASFVACACIPNRDWRHLSLLAGVLGASACVLWLSTTGLATSNHALANIIAVWGACVGTIPASFLIDEVETLDKADMPSAAAFAIVVLATPLILVPSLMGTAVSEGRVAAYETQRELVRPERPVVAETLARGMDRFSRLGLDEKQTAVLSDGTLGAIVELECATMGLQSGLRLLALLTGVLGACVAIPLLLFPGSRLTNIRPQ